mgnify:CR=1 FL=1|tara:strand:+ start:348 stop:803 length:456 start_codon:yes stop_codon:yes gene_type:complete
MVMSRKRSVTGQQKEFVHYHVAERHNPTKAARLAGYAYPKQAAYQLTRNPVILPLMREARQTLYQGELVNLAGDTLRQVMLDPDTPASAKVSAARVALELAGDLAKDTDKSLSDRSLAEVTPDELAVMIKCWEGERIELLQDTTAQECQWV